MKKKFQTGNVLTVSFAHMVHDTYSAFLAPILPLLIEKLGLSYSQVGLFSVIQRARRFSIPLSGLWQISLALDISLFLHLP